LPSFYKANIAYLVGSANKCIQGVPGFAYVFAKLSHLQTIKGNERTLSLSLYDQWLYMKKTKQFRFTPPTHVLKAFLTALREFQAESAAGRFQRYSQNQK
jgi:2-aminoethylphosphonate-pyruvate transaminase